MIRLVKTILFLLLFSFLLHPVNASVPDAFGRVMVSEGGRVMPLDSYARNLLSRFSGRQSLPGRSAVDWMADMLFRPDNTVNDAVFLIDNPDVYAALGLAGEKRGRLSFRHLEPVLSRLSELARSAFQLEPGRQSPVETGLLGLYENVYRYVTLRDASATGKGGLNLLPGDDPDQAWLPLSAASSEDHPGHPALVAWLAALKAYQEGRSGAFDTQIRAFNSFIASRPVAAERVGKVEKEVLYNHLDPFFWARIAYGVSLVFLLLSFLFWPLLIRRVSLLLLIGGWVIHTAGLVLRYLITHRSPVTNLFETFIFVAWAGVLLGLFLGLRRHLALCLTASGASGLAFLMVAARFATGDTMGQLMAVLNSNWWLSVHVITITAGYAGCVVAGIIGHVYIGQSLLKKSKPENLAHTMQMLYATLIFGLFFTFVGTVMGGIWADQSWGRFWGWDPKENGALVIILWVAVILHARLTRLIGAFGVAAGAVGTIIMVVLAWFGVNLLGVGMHSYGFTSGIAKGLMLFVIGELLFLLVTGVKTRQRRLPG